MTKLTKQVVEGIAIPELRPAHLWDDRISGFGIKVLPSGVRKYILKYRVLQNGTRMQKWLQLGRHGNISSEQARQLAQQASAAIARGEDPKAVSEIEKPAPDLKDAWARFTADYLAQKKPSTQRDYLSAWANLIEPELGQRKVISVTTDDVDRLHKSLRLTPYRANRMLALLSRIFNLTERWGWRNPGSNPCKGIEKFKENPRQRFLSQSEIVQLQSSLAELDQKQIISTSAANAIRLLLLTGARSSEVTKAQWAWLDEEKQVLSLPDSKSGAKLIYLSHAALQVCREQRKHTGKSAYMFPGRDPSKSIVNLRKPWLRVCSDAGLDGVRIHDLRHTAASVAIGAGASLTIVGKLLGHTQAQTTLRYAHLDSDPALVAANLLGAAISSATSENASK